MTEKPTLAVFREVFGDLLRPPLQPAPESEPAPTTGEEAQAKLKRNLSLALEVHKDAMTGQLVGEGGDKRLALEAANTTVKAALTTDRTALKARADNTIERVLLRLIVVRKYHGRENAPELVKKLHATPRAELEAALGQRWLKEYDRMEW
jgi:hypothetical protein